MSKHRNQDVRELLRNAMSMDRIQLETTLGVRVLQDGSIFDVLDNVHYDSLDQWAQSQIGQQGEKISHYHDDD